MIKNKITYYEMLVYIAYGFYLVLGTAWFLTTLLKGNNFNYNALIIVIVFGLQAYYKHKLANLIIGVLSLFFSFFMLMEVLNTFDLLSKNADFSLAAKLLFSGCVFSIVMAGILIFSYRQLGSGEEL